MRPRKPRQQFDLSPPDPISSRSEDPPDDRAARLAQLKRAIDTGTYRISSDQIADKLIDRLRDVPPKT